MVLHFIMREYKPPFILKLGEIQIAKHYGVIEAKVLVKPINEMSFT